MKILSLDQATNTTGYAIFENENLITYGYFTTKSKELNEKLVEIKEWVIDMVSENVIDFVVFEDIQLQEDIGDNVVTFKKLAEVLGVVDETLTEIDISHLIVLPTVWKSTVGIKGKKRPEQKKNAQIYVDNTYHKKVTEDTADAICIGTYYLIKNNIITVKDNTCAW